LVECERGTLVECERGALVECERGALVECESGALSEWRWLGKWTYCGIYITVRLCTPHYWWNATVYPEYHRRPFCYIQQICFLQFQLKWRHYINCPIWGIRYFSSYPLATWKDGTWTKSVIIRLSINTPQKTRSCGGKLTGVN